MKFPSHQLSMTCSGCSEHQRTTFVHRSQQLASLSIIALLLLAGCNNGTATGFAVSGNVTLDGTPLSNGLIMLMPTQAGTGLRTVSTNVSGGSFSIPPSSRLQAGSYKVVITAEKKTGRKISAEEGSSEMADEYAQYLPARYNINSILSAEISDNTAPLDFALELD